VSRQPAHPGTSPDCPICLGQGVEVVANGLVAEASLCRCVGTCVACGGSGFVRENSVIKRGTMRRCVCAAAMARVARFANSGIPARHANSSRASFRPYNRGTAMVLTVVSTFVRDFSKSSEQRGLVLYGAVGRGKTHLAVSVAREMVLTGGFSARFIEFSHLLSDLKAGFEAKRGIHSLMAPLVEVDLLVIDELGKGRSTEFELMVIDELISRRYNAMRPIIATTNYAPGAASGLSVANAALPNRSLPSLLDRIGERPYSRLRETCDFVHVRGDDFRERTRGRG
jgi:DNA replication protein DnaC